MARFTQSRRQGEGQGRRREAGSGGRPIRNGGAMNKNRQDFRQTLKFVIPANAGIQFFQWVTGFPPTRE